MFRARGRHRPRSRTRRFLKPYLDDLEARLVLTVSELAPAVSALPSVLRAQPLSTVASTGFTPEQIRTAFGIDRIGFGTITGDGAGQTIAIVDAYDDPGLQNSTSPNFKSSDLALFDRQFGLPDPPSFVKLGQDGTTNLPAADPTGLWEVEEALDVEWAHAIAPAASIVLIECNSSGYESLLVGGAKTAASLPGVSVVSMSFGTSEFSSEQYFDSVFKTPSGHQGVTFVASTGDYASKVDYPASSPDVLAVGGTSLFLNADSSYQYEATWPCSGAGTSAVRDRAGLSKECSEHWHAYRSRRGIRCRLEHRRASL